MLLVDILDVLLFADLEDASTGLAADPLERTFPINIGLAVATASPRILSPATLRVAAGITSARIASAGIASARVASAGIASARIAPPMLSCAIPVLPPVFAFV